MLAEFKKFVMRGNVMDLAVAVIIGGAFATITSSLTDDIIMPIVGFIFGGLDFSNYFIFLGAIPEGYEGSLTNYAELKEAGVAMIGFGQFISVAVNFIILAFVIFMMVRSVNKMMEKEEAKAPPPPPGPSETDLLIEIRDLLKSRS